MKRITIDEDAERPAADVSLENLLETHVKLAVSPVVYTRLLQTVDEVARTHYGRGYLAGGQAERYV